MPRLLRTSLALWTAAFVAGCASAFDLQGHRGARGLAPENTLAGFAAALAVGVDTLELDVLLTADDRVVVGHDPVLNPQLVRDAAGRWIDPPAPAVRTLTLAEVQRYDVGRLRPGSRYAESFPAQKPADGERMPTLDALIESVKARGAAHVRFNIETKLTPDPAVPAPDPEAYARAVIDVARRHGVLNRITLQSFDWRTLRAAQRLAPEVPTAALSVQRPNFDNIADGRWTAGLKRADFASLPAMVQAAGAKVWSPNFADLDAALVADARARGLKVIPWTVNDEAAIERVLDLGVDGIISDYPDRVRAALARRGKPLPPTYASPKGG